MKGEFPEGLYRFSGLHDYDNFLNVINNNKINPDFEWQWKLDTDSGKVLNNPEGISVVEYRKVGATEWKEKTLAPKGTTAEEFMDAGFVLRDDYLGGKTMPPDPIDNTIKSTTKFQDTEYIIQGYSGIATSIENSSWWFTLPD